MLRCHLSYVYLILWGPKADLEEYNEEEPLKLKNWAEIVFNRLHVQGMSPFSTFYLETS
jgi:hypothetical protein